MLMMTILLAAAILVYALHRKRDVKFNVRLLGANVLLEAKDGDGTRDVEGK
jgi:hypothetical protein